MADKAISELLAANQVTPTDLFVLEQSGTAKKLTGQILENWLVSFADGHGGIQSIVKASTSGLVDTYRITLADTTTFDFRVTNGKSVNSIEKTSTSGLVDTYTIRYNDSTSSTFTVTNGAKGDKGDNTYTWIKYASQKPTESSHSFGDVPDNWIGVYSGASDTAPTDWQEYSWFQIKGEKGDTGAAATVISNVVEYQVGDSGTIIPSGAWGASIPVVAQGKYLWTRTTTTFNSGSSAVSYSVSRMGIDGTGSVSSVANISPDVNGNVPLTADDVGALPTAGGTMTGGINMNGQPLNGLNAPTADDEAATKGYVDNAKPDMTGYATEEYVNDALKNFESGMSMELLWENASPASAFASQTISLDLSNFEYVAIDANYRNSASGSALFIFKVGANDFLNNYQIDDNSVYFFTRMIGVSSVSIWFGSGYYTVGLTPTKDEARMIPLRIYGIKGVSR